MRQQRLGATHGHVYIYIMYIHICNMYIICAICMCNIFCDYTIEIISYTCVVYCQCKKIRLQGIFGWATANGRCRAVSTWRRECDSLIMTMEMTMNEFALTIEFYSSSSHHVENLVVFDNEQNSRDRNCNRDRSIFEHSVQQNMYTHH